MHADEASSVTRAMVDARRGRIHGYGVSLQLPGVPARCRASLDESHSMADRDDSSIGRIMLVILVFAALGTPMFLYLWETLNGLLNGHLDGTRLLVSLPVLALFAGLLALLRRVLARLGPTPASPFPTGSPPSRR